MSQALRKLTGAISKSNCVAIFINQLREKVGVMFGSPEVTPGGRALKFYSSVRIEIRKGDVIKTNGELAGSHTKVKVKKNKVAPPFREAEFDIMYGKGISKTGEIVDLGVLADVIQKSGSWFNYGERRLAQGRDNVKALFEKEPELAAEIEKKIMENIDKISAAKPEPKKKKGKKGSAAEEEAALADETVDVEITVDEPAAAPTDDDASIDIMVED